METHLQQCASWVFSCSFCVVTLQCDVPEHYKWVPQDFSFPLLDGVNWLIKLSKFLKIYWSNENDQIAVKCSTEFKIASFSLRSYYSCRRWRATAFCGLKKVALIVLQILMSCAFVTCQACERKGILFLIIDGLLKRALCYHAKDFTSQECVCVYLYVHIYNVYISGNFWRGQWCS